MGDDEEGRTEAPGRETDASEREPLGVVGELESVRKFRENLLKQLVPKDTWAAATGIRADAVNRFGGVGELESVRKFRENLLNQFALKGAFADAPWRSTSFGISERTFADAWWRQADKLREVVERLRTHERMLWPPNLRALDEVTFDAVEEVVLRDGIPLYAVPRPSIAAAIIAAPSYAARRAIIGRRWETIAGDCTTVLQGLESSALAEEVEFAKDAAAALLAGHTRSAQALAANLLDTIVRRHFAADRVVLTPSRRVRTPQGYEDFLTRKFLAVAPIWEAYQQYWVENGDPVPRRFARHASAHAVARRQYSKRNAVQALMLVTGLLSFLESHGLG